MASKTAAALVAGKDVSAAIDKAVALAATRNKVEVSAGNLITNWELIGRTMKNAALADAFAGDVAATLNKGGMTVTPASLRWGKQILCGFFEKARLPQMRPFV